MIPSMAFVPQNDRNLVFAALTNFLLIEFTPLLRWLEDSYLGRPTSSPITLNFKKTNNCTKDVSCLAWSLATEVGGYGHWNKSGCTKVNETNYEVTFRCTHLTNFALLFDHQTTIKPQSDANYQTTNSTVNNRKQS